MVLPALDHPNYKAAKKKTKNCDRALYIIVQYNCKFSIVIWCDSLINFTNRVLHVIEFGCTMFWFFCYALPQ